MKQILFIIMTAIFTSCAALESVSPSGNVQKRFYDYTSFSKISVGSSLFVQLRETENEQFSIDCDDNLWKYLVVEKKGDKINVYLENVNIRGQHHIMVYVNYKNLSELNLSGAARGDLDMITKFNNVNIKLSGASKLEGNAKASTLDIDISGASKLSSTNLIADKAKIELSGASKCEARLNSNTADIELSGASNFEAKGNCSSIILDCSGASQTNCYNLLCENLNAKASGASTCKHAVSRTLSARLSGASSLYYDGIPEITSQNITGTSSLRKR
jgi:hypothetical protein